MTNPILILLDQFKKGIRTSEFWLMVVAAAYNAVMTGIDPSRPFSQQIPGLAMLAGAAVYGAVRTWLKVRRVTALAVTAQGYEVYPAGGVPTA